MAGLVRAPSIALVAGELSGDLLGASVVRSLRERFPDARLYGVVGPRMLDAGCEAIGSIDELSVMGLAEVLPAIPRLLRLRKRLVTQLSRDPPDLLIGLDAPDFNLGLERRLRQRGVRTAHIVSPTIWAWRAGRVKGIAQAVELMLCLYPFEPACYQGHAVKARFVGHPLADELDDAVPTAEARSKMNLDGAGPWVAVLPGSRGSELKYLAAPFARAAALLHERVPGIRFITPVARPALEGAMREAIRQWAPRCRWTLVAGQSREAMQAADAVLLASGTATLECLLLGRPMVVAYRASAVTAWMMLDLGLLKARHVSLPNLLSGQPCVPELLQEAASPEALAAEIQRLLDDAALRNDQLRSFSEIRARLRCNAADQVAQAVAELLSSPEPAKR
ncbi:MAG: lipid-A-disaccharide synthase [Panacagrimonas sp.]